MPIEMDSHHRKIDLQSPADLTYLLNNIKKAAQEKIDLAIPRSAAPEGEEDAYRNKVEELVQEYITQTLTLALPNLSINGFDASSSLLNSANSSSIVDGSLSNPSTLSDDDIAAGNYEAYDPRLAERLRALYVQFEAEAEDVARMRREVPKKAAERYTEGLKKEMEGEIEVKREDGDEKMEVDVPPLATLGQRKGEVERMWVRGREELEGLEGITGVIGRLEQAGRAVEVVEGRE